MPPIRVHVPATSANLGPGFDCLGLALGLTNTVELEATGDKLHLTIKGEGVESLPANADNAIVQAAYAVYRHLEETPPPLRFTMENRIPPCSGLGSSAAAQVAGIVAANALLDYPLSEDEMLRLAVERESHPDNVVPALVGSLTINSYVDQLLISRRVTIAPLTVVVVMPAVTVSTMEARRALPLKVPLADAAANIGRAALVVQALVEGDFDLLGEVMHDRLHEPTRKQFIPAFDRVVDAAYQAGARAVAISGAGPSLIAFAESDQAAIGEAMVRTFKQQGNVEARAWVLPVNRRGAWVEE